MEQSLKISSWFVIFMSILGLVTAISDFTLSSILIFGFYLAQAGIALVYIRQTTKREGSYGKTN